MITCRECNDLLIDYRAGDLTAGEDACVAAHLLYCSPCVVSLKNYEETIRLARRAFNHPDDALPILVPNELVLAILAVHFRSRC